MKIDEFAKLFGQSKRNVDYWTNLGLLHPKINEDNGYRDYGEEAKEDMKKIAILKSAGMKLDKDHLTLITLAEKNPEVKKMLRSLIEGMREKATKQYNAALAFLKEV